MGDHMSYWLVKGTDVFTVTVFVIALPANAAAVVQATD